MPVRFGRTLRQLPKELPPRLNALLAVLVVAAWIVMFRYWEMDKGISAHTLVIGAGVVIAIGCLIYTPPELLRTLVVVAVGGVACYAFKGDLLVLAVAILVGLCCWAYWFTVGIAQVNEQMLKRLDCLQEKLEEIEWKQDGM